MAYFQLQLPISRSTVFGLKHIDNVNESLKQDFRMLLLTVPGEKIDNPEYGCGLPTFVFENDTPSLRKSLENIIRQKTLKFLPLINITNIFFDYNENSVLTLQIKFYIGNANNTSEITFQLNTEE